MIKRAFKKINKQVLPTKLFFPPKYIVLGVNNVCNLHCKMCDVGTDSTDTNFAQNLVGSKPLNMPFELFKTIADQTAQYFPSAKMGYAFTEPLAYPLLGKTLEYSTSLGLTNTITTNALNLKRKTDQLLGTTSEIHISLDGLQKTHNYIRGNKKSFQKAVEGIEHISTKKNAPEISVYCVITEWNYNELKEFTDFFAKLPIKQIGFMHQNFVTKEIAGFHNAQFGNHYHATHSNIDSTDFEKINLSALQNQIQKIQNQSYKIPVTFSPNITRLESLQQYYFQPKTKLGKVCNDIFTNLMIKTDGSVIPSHGRCYNLKVGNIYSNNLKEIWNSPIYGKFRQDLLNAGGLMPACSRCCSAFNISEK